MPTRSGASGGGDAMNGLPASGLQGELGRMSTATRWRRCQARLPTRHGLGRRRASENRSERGCPGDGVREGSGGRGFSSRGDEGGGREGEQGSRMRVLIRLEFGQELLGALSSEREQR